MSMSNEKSQEEIKNDSPQEKTESSQEKSQAYLLQQLSNIQPEDVDKLVDFYKGNLKDKEYHKNINTYLELVRQVFGSNSTYLLTGSNVTTRQTLYEIYDEMDESTAYISSALDILSDDATQPDEEGVIVRVHSESEKVQNLLDDLFEDIEVDANIAKWARAIAKYGDLFLGVESNDEDGITSIDDTIYPSTIERKDFRGKLVAFQDTFSQNAVSDSFFPPWEYVHFRHKGDLYRQHNPHDSIMNKKQYNLSSSYGQSILKPAIKVYAQLRFVENMIILSRLTNSIRRNIFMVNVGSTDPNSAFDTIRNYANLLKKDISLDIEDSIYNSQKHTVNYDEDIFLPVNDPKNDVRIEQVGGDANIGEQYDLEYLLNKLFAALKIPKAYLNYEQDLNARSTLIQLDIRYARSVAQLQNTLVAGLMRLASIHLAYHGIDPNEVDFEISLPSVSSIDLEAKLEAKEKKVSVAQSIWDLASDMYDKMKEVDDALAEAASMEEEPTEPEEEETTDEEPADGEESEPLDREIEEPEPEPEVIEEEPKPLLDMKYLAEKIFVDYLDFTKEDVCRLLGKEEEVVEEAKQERIRDRLRTYSNADLRSFYPGATGHQLFESSVAKLTRNNIES